MRLHANAPLGPKGRATMVRRVVAADWSLTQAAEAAGVSERTASKWVARYRREGEVGLADRSSAPKALANRTDESRIETIAALRRLRMTGAEIAECLEMALSTVSGVLARIGLGKLSRLEPPEPANRYERARPGELIHIDVKKLGAIKGGLGHRAHGSRRHSPRGGGWEFVHVCVDDATRLAYVEVLGDEKASTAVGFLRRATAFYRAPQVAHRWLPRASASLTSRRSRRRSSESERGRCLRRSIAREASWRVFGHVVVSAGRLAERAQVAQLLGGRLVVGAHLASSGRGRGASPTGTALPC